MKKYYITKYIMVSATVEAASPTEAVKKFEANLDASTNYEHACKHDIVFGSSGEPDTVEEIHPVGLNGHRLNRFSLVGHIAGGDFLPSKDFPDA